MGALEGINWRELSLHQIRDELYYLQTELIGRGCVLSAKKVGELVEFLNSKFEEERNSQNARRY